MEITICLCKIYTYIYKECPMEHHTSLGENIRRARLNKGLTQEQLAELCDKKTPYITSVETGTRKPKLPNIQQIAKALGVDYRTLLEAPPQAEEVSEEFSQYQMAMQDIGKVLKKYFKHEENK
jgi:transcriptional regulator with XRE-family HTH domain